MTKTVSLKLENDKIIEIKFDTDDGYISYTGQILDLGTYDYDNLTDIADEEIALQMRDNPNEMIYELEDQSISELREYLVNSALDDPMEIGIDCFDSKSTDDTLVTIEYDAMGQIAESLRKLIKEEDYIDYEARQILLKILDNWDKYHLTSLENNDELAHALTNQMDQAKEYFSESTHELAEKLLKKA